ncbi:hypothetical protein GTS_26380 [Gandjariella thermophila]|uniref:MmyB-like transcription regulator ligand binding domain-containing protein n=2 Tax=Gandjariella thermophila TaxID=1931992 RepID=A0A4D4J2Y1_9PSEU|nr:hypothetical protein GTS_26380 [Gandjariella thermophila]
MLLPYAALRHMVATFRDAYGRRLGDPDWECLISRLSAASAEFAAMWADHDVQAPSTRQKVYRHASAGDFALSVTGFALAADPDLRMMVYNPVDDDSRRRVDWLTTHPDAPVSDHTHSTRDPVRRLPGRPAARTREIRSSDRRTDRELAVTNPSLAGWRESVPRAMSRYLSGDIKSRLSRGRNPGGVPHSRLRRRRRAEPGAEASGDH